MINMLLYQVLACTIHGKRSDKNNKYKMPALTWSEKLDLPDESYSVSDIQNYFEYTIKK